MASFIGRRAVALALFGAVGCSDDPTLINGPGVLITPPPVLATSELGDELAFEMVLAAPPEADVRVPLEAIPIEEGAVEPAELVFTPANWNQPQTFRVFGVDDEIDDGVRSFTLFAGPLASADLDYNGLALGDYDLRNYDDEIAVELFDPGDEMSPPSLLIFEGFVSGTGETAPLGTSAGVRLTDPPRVGTEVVLELSLVNAEGDASFVAGDPDALTTTLTFDEDNYAATQVVDIASFDDGFEDNGPAIELQFAITTDDPVYTDLSLPPLEIVQVDDENAAITITPKMFALCEGQSRAIDVALSTVPELGDVTVGLQVDADGELRASGGPLVLGGTQLTGRITLSAADDEIEQGDRVVTVNSVVTTADPVYGEQPGQTISVTIIDNDPRVDDPDPIEPTALVLCPLEPQ